MIAPFVYGSVCSGIEAATVAWHPFGWQAAFYSEMEPFARAALQHHYPEVPLHGDFTTIRRGDYSPIELLVGGTPCQSFSIAGLRGGLADDRGNLSLEYLRLADRLGARWVVWENVPGVLSSNGGRDFGAILGGLVELGYGVGYRVLDAQHFGVPQRRRRVILVGYLGDWRPAAAVLFERESLSGNPAPRRETGQGTSAGVGFGPQGGRFTDTSPTLDTRAKDGPIRNQLGVGILHAPDISPALKARDYKGPSSDGDGDGAPLVSYIAPPLTSNPYGDHESREGLLVAHTLRAAGFDASEDGSGRGVPLVPVAFVQNSRDEVQLFGQDGSTVGALAAEPGMKQQSYIAFTSKDHDAEIQETWRSSGNEGQPAHGRSAVRRLTPREAERLQGFPDDYTMIPYRGKPATDGPRYRALGNSMAVPVMRWVGERINLVRGLIGEAA